MNTRLAYVNEYIGNTSRLVITPLTDRCYRTLMAAMKENLGGAPEGPAGTGKTETVKDLSKAVAVKTLVFNCSEGLDYKSMGKLFKGLISVGAWSCFDEFNRIEVEVLSVIAQQILSIQSAKKMEAASFDFEGEVITLRKSCNIFITMNPGYAGRTELPDNLKVLFRPIAMIVPDYSLIAEIRLYSCGFLEARTMAKKVVATYRLCSEQLSSQSHYDYGMRAVIAALSAAGRLKRQFPDEREEVLILNAIYDSNAPKFLPNDIQLFKWIIADLFPNSSISPKKDYYEVLVKIIKEAMTKLNLQHIDKFIEKILQLYETINSRHGLMIVGNTLTGKSTLYKTLASSLNSTEAHKLNEYPVEYYIINPKAIILNQLYGSLDRISQEWTEGILAKIFRDCASDKLGTRKWIVLDGPVDTVWVESMNTVLDDNRMLCLMNGDVIAMTERMTMMFEVSDLAKASPATVSRCGMIYMQEDIVAWWDILKSWVSQLNSEAIQKKLEILFDAFIDKTCKAMKRVMQYIKMNDMHLVLNLIKLLAGLLKAHKIEHESNVNIEIYFMYALIHCIGCNTNEQGYKEISSFLRGLANESIPLQRIEEKSFRISKAAQLPESSAPLHAYYIEGSKWKLWREQLESKEQYFEENIKYHEIVVQTADTLKFNWLLHFMISNEYSVIGIGPTGTGKTLCIKSFMRSLDKERYITLVMNLSGHTTANQIQEALESKLETRKRGVLAPRYPKKFIAFIDDLNMPAPDLYGAQPAIEFLRQFFDIGGWYNADKDRKLKRVEDVLIISAMAPPGGGRNEITQRILKHFQVLTFNSFDTANLNKIFTTLMKWHIKTERLSTDLIKTLSNTVAAIIDLYTFISDKILPTPEKHHYLFNIRDISRVVQGIQMANLKSINNKKLIRLFIHEASRVFMDRFITDQDKEEVYSRLERITRDHFHEDLSIILSETTSTKTYKALNNIVFTDIMSIGLSTYERSYEEVIPSKSLYDKVNSYLEEYNRCSKKPMQLVMFDYAVEHLLRICRVLRMSKGHALLIGVGGSGRQSLAKLATNICDFSSFDIEITKSHNKEVWHEDLKRLIKEAGDKRIVFVLSDSQTKSQFVLEDVNSLLNIGEVFNLWNREEQLEIMEMTRSIAKKHKRDMLADQGSKEQLYNYFLERVNSNLHIVMTMSPVGGSLRNNLRMFPSLVNCCTIDWFDKWPESGLRAVAIQFLGDLPQIVQVCTDIHTEVEIVSGQLLKEEHRHNYITPIVYIELVRSYIKLLKSQKESLVKGKQGYIKGIEKMKLATEEIEVKQRKLEEKSPHLEEMNKKVAELITKVNIQINEVVEPKKKFVIEEEEMAAKQAQEAEQLLADCTQELAKFTPKLKEAQSKMDALTVKDINELRTYKDPPRLVKVVLEAVAILREFPIVYTPKADNPKEMEANMWATAKKLLTQQNFLSGFSTFDYNSIKLEVIEKIRKKYIAELNPMRLRDVSKAAHALCLWIRAIEEYDKAYRVVRPKELRAKEAKAEYEEKMLNLKRIQEELQSVVKTLQQMQEDLEKQQEKKSKLKDEIENCTTKIKRAKTLLEGLSGEKTRWVDCIEEYKTSYETIEGDMLIASAIITYLGPFPSRYRNPMINKWIAKCSAVGIKINKDFSLEKSLGDPVLVNEWVLNGLPAGSFSRENGIIATKSCRWPLMIDPEGQANRWVKNQYQRMKLNIVKGTDNYIKVFKKAIPFGEPLLLEDIGTDIDSALDSVLQKQTFKQSGVVSIKLGDGIIDYSNNFLLFITTKQRWPHYLPEVSTKVTIIDFALTCDGLQDQVLDLVIQKERQELDEKRSRLIIQSHKYKYELKKCEGNILEVLSSGQDNILDDEAVVNTVNESQETAVKVKEKQRIALETEESLELVRKEYIPIAKHVASLYFIVSNLSKLNEMYQYSLVWYLALLTRAIEIAERSEYIEQRLEALREQFTKLLYENIVQSLFEKDKLIFSFLLATCVEEDKLDIQSYKHFISFYSLRKNEKKNIVQEWLPNNTWNSLCELVSNTESLANLLNNISENTEDWISFYKTITETNNSDIIFPECIKQIRAFEKLNIIKAIAPERLLVYIKNYIKTTIGPEFLICPPFDLEAAYKGSSAFTPIIFILPGADPLVTLQSFAQNKAKVDTMKIVSLGQDQGPFAIRLIKEAKKFGNWVLLQNCHLAPSFMPTLEKICDDLQSKSSKDQVNRSFRLWLTSYASEYFPVSVLQHSIKLTNEVSKGNKGNLLNSFLTHPIKELYNTGDFAFKRTALSLCFFHTLIQERSSFGSLGWNIPYRFNQSDMLISVKQLHEFLQEDVESGLKLLRYLIGECNYGGRVTDDKDRRLLKELVNDFFSIKQFEVAYCLYGLPEYTFPDSGSTYDEYYEYLVKKIPDEQPAELYGLHENAFITRNLKEYGSLLSSLQKVGDSHLINKKLYLNNQIDDTSIIKPFKHAELLNQILSKLPEDLFDLEDIAKRYPPLYENSMNAVLTQELNRFNILLMTIKSSLEKLLSALKGESLMSFEIEEINEALAINKVPDQWLAKSYPSLKPFLGYLADLHVRLSFFNDWVVNGPPPVFWISGFFFTQSFLTGILQNYARLRYIPINELVFNFEFLQEDPTDYNIEILDRTKVKYKEPEHGVHISGLYIEGCRWDFKEKVLAESFSRVLFSKVPVIWFKPTASMKVGEGYSCPVYKTTERKGVLDSAGYSTNYIMDITMPSKVKAEHWIKRGVAMITQLSI